MAAIKIAAIVFYVNRGNEEVAREKIKAIVDKVSQDLAFRDAGLDQSYADPDALLFDKDDLSMHTID